MDNLLNVIWLAPVITVGILGAIFLFTTFKNLPFRIQKLWKKFLDKCYETYFEYELKDKTIDECFGNNYFDWERGDVLYFKMNRVNDTKGVLQTFHPKKVIVLVNGKEVVPIPPAKIISNETAEKRRELKKAEQYHEEVFPLVSESSNKSKFLTD